MCLGPKKAIAAAAQAKSIEDKKPAAVVQPQTATVSAIPSLQPLPAGGGGSLVAITEGLAETAPTASDTTAQPSIAGAQTLIGDNRPAANGSANSDAIYIYTLVD